MRFNGLMVRFKKQIRKPFEVAGEVGMSMIEIMIVISLIGILMTYIIRNVMQSADNAKADQAKIGMNMLVQDLQRYKLDNNKYPTTEQGLNALLTNPGGDAKNWRGPYTEDNKINDPWAVPFQYESDGRTVKMRSSGVDQQMGTEDDISYPPAKQGEQP
jgi:general secretion pathway protein G